MANNFFKVKKGLKIEPNTVAGTEAGDIRVDSAASNKPKYFNGSSEDIIPTAASTDTLTNKTIVASSNTITTAASGNLTSVELNAALAELQSDVDTRALSSDLSTHISDTTTHGTTGDIVGTSDSQTLSNKSIDADQNTITNIENADIKAGAAIARSKLADGTADHVLINSAAGAMSSEATLAKSRGGAGADMSSVTFPSTGTIVTRAATEDLSNKTFTNPITLEEQGSSPSAPSSGDRKFYSKTDGKIYHMGSDGVEKAVGSGAGGGVNYHDDYDCDNISKVTTYDDGASAPTDGTGGTVNYASTSLETSSPLAGTSSYKLSKSANNAQGEGWAIDSSALDDMETVAGQMLWIDFSYKTSANFVADDVKVYVYRVGSNTLEALNTFQGSSMSNTLPVAANGARYTGWVTCSSSDTSIRLILHCASTSALAYDIHVDRLSIGPQSVVQSGIQSDWQSYTPTGSWVSNTTYTGFWRRVGDSMEISVKANCSGAPTAAALTINLPSGYTIDTAKYSTGKHVGISYIEDASVAGYYGLVYINSTTSLGAGLGVASGTYLAGTAINSTTPFTFGASDYVVISASVPISGWTSGNTMSTAELQVRSAVANYSTNAGQTISTGTVTIVDFEDKITDTHNAVTTGASWKFTAPSTGNYQVNATNLFVATTGWAEDEEINIYVYKNGIIFREMGRTNGHDASSAYVGVHGSTIVPMLKGDYIDVRIKHDLDSSLALLSDSLYNHVSIAQLPDLTVIGIGGQPFEVKSNTSSTKTPSGSGHFHSHTNNSITLTPGTWELIPSRVYFYNGGTTPAYSSIQAGWSGANGADNGTMPTSLSSTSGITVLTHPSSSDWDGRALFIFPSGTSDLSVTTPSVIIRCTSTVTVYLNTYSVMTTPSNARITVYPNARRLQ